MDSNPRLPDNEVFALPLCYNRSPGLVSNSFMKLLQVEAPEAEESFGLPQHGLPHGGVSGVVDDAHEEGEEERTDEVHDVDVDVVGVLADGERRHLAHLVEQEDVDSDADEVEERRRLVRDGLALDDLDQL